MYGISYGAAERAADRKYAELQRRKKPVRTVKLEDGTLLNLPEPGNVFGIKTGELKGKLLDGAFLNEEDGYADVTAPDGTVLCMDGERCTVVSADDGKICFRNCDGGEPEIFAVTPEGFADACFQTVTQKTAEN